MDEGFENILESKDQPINVIKRSESKIKYFSRNY